jgi:hypothetical protein
VLFRSCLTIIQWGVPQFNRQAFEALFDGRVTDEDLRACRGRYDVKDCILRAAALPQPDPDEHFTDKHHIILVWPKGNQPFHSRFIRKVRRDAPQWTPGKYVSHSGRL